ncbi:MAG: Bax inhibitor-1/YccA family protein [Burkholderiales bacterium]|jgi:modulator of FtsH protease|nr:Bax inhibitor-1/YccA family protein [Burkholderiales bacterium]
MNNRASSSIAAQIPETLRLAQQNRVLRNTYALLALSLIPTIVGAYVASVFNFEAIFLAYPIAAPLGFFALAIGMMFVVTALRNSAWGIVALFAFTFVFGFMVTPILTYAASFSNGGQLIALAAGMTATIFFVLAGIASTAKRDFSFMGKFLFAGLITVILAAIANLFFQIPALSLTISCVAILLFSGYILYDVNRIVRGGETNYIMATMSIFISLYNLFVSLYCIFC